MKKFDVCCLIVVFLLFIKPVFATETIELKDSEQNKIKYTKQIDKDVKNLVADEETIKAVIEYQKKKDIEDIEYLWDKTVENSNLVKFALKKLAIPEEQRRLHSSVMAKSLSAVISGAAYIPMLLGQNSLIQSASFSASRIITGLLARSETPQEELMTDTELIELAGMIEKLQTELLNTYYNYKNSLIQLKNVRARIMLANNNYYNALKTNNKMEILISSNLYDNLLIEEQQIKQKTWCYQLQLQKLAGAESIKHLHLNQYALNNELTNGKDSK